jgi:hypothetical protein
MKGILRPRALLLALAVTLTLAGCGSAERERSSRPEDVVRAWADAQRASDVDRATALFALPAVVFNGGDHPVTLRSSAEVRSFNASLPCGGRVLATERRAAFVVATFRLTDRPGSRCDGPGGIARAAFKVRQGRIVEWLRVPAAIAPAPGASPPSRIGPEV